MALSQGEGNRFRITASKYNLFVNIIYIFFSNTNNGATLGIGFNADFYFAICKILIRFQIWV